MNTNEHGWEMGKEAVNKSDFLYKEESHRIIGCAFEVLNVLGHGLLEKPYENALVVEFQQQGISYTQQPRFPVIYKFRTPDLREIDLTRFPDFYSTSPK